MRCTYVLSVKPGSWCPSHSWICLMFRPASKSSEASAVAPSYGARRSRYERSCTDSSGRERFWQEWGARHPPSCPPWPPGELNGCQTPPPTVQTLPVDPVANPLPTPLLTVMTGDGKTTRNRPSAGSSGSRRPDSNRGPLHYEAAVAVSRGRALSYEVPAKPMALVTVQSPRGWVSFAGSCACRGNLGVWVVRSSRRSRLRGVSRRGC